MTGAVFGFSGACRFLLERGSDGPTVVWLMCNPSRADATTDDPTIGRVRWFSAKLNCPRVLVVNVWALVATDPADLWTALRAGRYSPEMDAANLDILAMAGAQADFTVAAFGAAPFRDHPRAVSRALDALGGGPWLCLGTTGDGAPLHPLARGKLAIRKDTDPRAWTHAA